MKTAIISDIHGNAPAFKAVLEDTKNKGITNYIHGKKPMNYGVHSGNIN